MNDQIASALNDYSVKIERFVQYPRTVGLQYAVIGLADESAELLGKCAVPQAQIRRKQILDEIGDCMFYAARVCQHSERRFDDAYTRAMALEWGVSADFLSVAAEAVVCAGEILGGLKKVLREDVGAQGKLDAKIAANLPRIVRALDVLSRGCGYDIIHAAEANVDKLSGRLENGTIKGDGDSR